jgi:hypothetical protein
VTEFLHWTATQINRRTFLKRALGGAFATYAGVAAGARGALAFCEYNCAGPYQTGRCAQYLCNGPNCQSAQGITCTKITGFCPSGGACWTNSGHTCCDCFCHVDPPINWYCYCDIYS